MAQIGKKTTITSTTVTALAEVLEIGDYSFSRSDVEDTSYGTTVWRTYIAGLIEGGSIPFRIAVTKADTAIESLETLFNAGTSESWTVTFADGSKWVFTAYVNGMGGSQPMDDLVTLQITLKIDGKTPPAYTAGT